MRHRKAGRRLGRNKGARKSLMRNLAVSLFRHERIRSTDSKCRELRPYAEKLISIAKRALPPEGTEPDSAMKAREVHARRVVRKSVPDREIVDKVFNEIAPRFRDRQGGYTRIVKIGHRPGDSAEESLIELVARVEAPAAAE